jgi:hypothetical protein
VAGVNPMITVEAVAYMTAQGLAQRHKAEGRAPVPSDCTNGKG